MSRTPDFLAQHHALNHTAGLSKVPRTLLSVTGSDRTQFLQSFTTNDIKKLIPGSGCEAFVTNTQGKTLGHVLIFCEANQFVLDTSPAQAPTLIAHFDRYVITEDVQFTDRTAEFCDLLIAGPSAASLLKSVTSIDPPTALLEHTSATIAGCPVVLRRVDFAGPFSFFVHAAAADSAAVATALSAAGSVQCDAAALESARLEAGFPLFGLDITVENLPQEVARDRQAISFIKGCYLGQETVARIDAVGHVNRLLVGVKCQSNEIPTSGTPLLADNQPIGHVTSAAWSPRLNSPLALGYVRRAHSKPGAALSSALGAAEVVSLPLASP